MPSELCSRSLHEAPESPLHRAARLGDHAEIRRLVALGADLESPDHAPPDPKWEVFQGTPLMVAAGSGDGATEETVRVLLELGADPKVVVGERSAALNACEGIGCLYIRGGDVERLKVLLAAGSPLPTDRGLANALLCEVAERGDAEMVSVLVAHGIDAKGYFDPVATKERLDRFHDMMAALRELPLDFNVAVEALTRTYKKAPQTREEREDIERQSSAPAREEIPIFRAAASGNAACVQTLLDAGADPLVRDCHKSTALFYAGSDEVVRLLMSVGLKLNDDADCCTPLEAAIYGCGDYVSRVRTLLEAGADVNVRAKDGATIFMAAVGWWYRTPALLRLLVSFGADPRATSLCGSNAFHAAICGSHDRVAGTTVRSTLRYLHELGVNIEQRNQERLTPLGKAIDWGDDLEIRTLCELGADPNVSCPSQWRKEPFDPDGDLPLLFNDVLSNRAHRGTVVEALLKAGANPLVRDKQGRTPLECFVLDACKTAPELAGTFLERVRAVRLSGDRTPRKRVGFVTTASPGVRASVIELIRDIPIPSDREDKRSYAQILEAIVHVRAYEDWWERHGCAKVSKPG